MRITAPLAGKPKVTGVSRHTPNLGSSNGADEKEMFAVTMTTSTRLATRPVFAVLQAGDVDRARKFYGGTLGLHTEDAPGGNELVVHAGGGTQLLLYHSEMTQPSDSTVAMWGVDDLKMTMAELRDRGIQFEDYDMTYLKTVDGIAEDASGWAAWFKDSEGNIINVMQRR